MQKNYILTTIKNKFINEQEVKGIIKNQKGLLIIVILTIISLITISSVSAADLNETDFDSTIMQNDNEITLKSNDSSSELVNQIINAKNGAEILINPGTYKIHDLLIEKNITLQGNGDPRDIIFDGERLSSILLTRSPDAYLTVKNITFINGLTYNFGGAISMETGHVYVDNCIFTNNTALGTTNAGGISNYGTKENPGYLLVNNSLFTNNYADHDGGAITTCYATSDIYNSVFINNSAFRDGGAIRVSLGGYGTVADCIFMYNYAHEWGGAYYSWASNSQLDRCIFMNNTAGTNGGAVMVSGNLTLTNSILVNNTAHETGGSFFISQPMFDATTVINVNNNIITNNTSPLGKEVYIEWKTIHLLFTKFNNNDWGSEDPTDSSLIDPNHVTKRSQVTSTIKSNLLNQLNLDLLDKYSDLIEDYFPENYLNDNFATNHEKDESQKQADIKPKTNMDSESEIPSNTPNISSTNSTTKVTNEQSAISIGNSISYGDDTKAYELNESKSVAKAATANIEYAIIAFVIVLFLLFIGYKTKSKEE